MSEAAQETTEPTTTSAEEKPETEVVIEETKPEEAQAEPADEPEKPADEKAEPEAPKPEALTVDLTSDEEPPPPPDKAAIAWAKSRQERREQKARIRELEERLAATTKPQRGTADPGPMPTLETVEWQADLLPQAILDWKEKKDAHARAVQAAKAKEEAEQREWQATVASYDTKKKALPADRVADAESFILETLNPVQQSIAMAACDNPALVFVGLAAHPDKAAALAKLTDPVKFTAALVKLESSMTVKKKPATQPEKKPTGGGELSSSATLDRLLKKAQETGNFTEYFAYKEKQGG